MRTTPEQRAKFEDQIRSIVIPRWLKEAYALDIATDLLADLTDLERRVEELSDQWSIMARACDNYREWPGQAASDHDHPDWQAAARAIIERDALEAENARMQEACIKTEYEVQQILGKALGYPWYKDDQQNWPNATESDGICVGEHVAASLALEATDCIKRLREHFDRTNINNKEYEDLGRLGEDWPMACRRWKREAEHLRETLRKISKFTNCQGPGCFWCKDGTPHPSTNEATLATMALRVTKRKNSRSKGKREKENT